MKQWNDISGTGCAADQVQICLQIHFHTFASLFLLNKGPSKIERKTPWSNVPDRKGLTWMKRLDCISAAHANIVITKDYSSQHVPEYVGSIAKNSSKTGIVNEDALGPSFDDENRYNRFHRLLIVCTSEHALLATFLSNQNIYLSFLDSSLNGSNIQST